MKRQNWWQLSLIQVGGAICLPMIMVGQMLGATYGLVGGLLGVILGNAILVLLGLGVASLSTRYGETTPVMSRRFIGPLGAPLFSIAFMIKSLGWFAIQLGLMSLAAVELVEGIFGYHLPIWSLNLGLGMVIGSLALFGLRGMARLAMVSMPVLIATMAIAAYQVSGQPIHYDAISLGGVSLAIAAAIGAVFNLPTFFVSARSHRSRLLAVLVSFGVALPLIEMVGVYIGITTPGLNLLEALGQNGGYAWKSWILFFLLLAGWTTNNTNLYGAAACLKMLISRMRTRMALAICALIGTILACLPLLEHFTLALNLIGVSVISFGSIMVVRYLINLKKGDVMGRGDYILHLIAWVVGMTVGIAATFDLISLSGIPVLDAGVASIIPLSITLFIGRKEHALLR